MGKQTKPQSKLQALFEKRAVLIGFGLLALLLAFMFVLWAIDSGSLLDYALVLLLVFVGIRDLAVGILKKRT